MIKLTKDGRTIRTGKHYTLFRAWTHTQQSECCSNCGRYTSLEADIEYYNSFHLHHIGGRGGGKRDDVPGKTTGLCWRCHREAHQ